jgi:hypothetical protein
MDMEFILISLYSLICSMLVNKFYPNIKRFLNRLSTPSKSESKTDLLFKIPDKEIQGEFKQLYDYLDRLEGREKKEKELNAPAVIKANEILNDFLPVQKPVRALNTPAVSKANKIISNLKKESEVINFPNNQPQYTDYMVEVNSNGVNCAVPTTFYLQSESEYYKEYSRKLGVIKKTIQATNDKAKALRALEIFYQMEEERVLFEDHLRDVKRVSN